MAGRRSSQNAVFQPSPGSLRKLVLDYLLHHSYLQTACAFAVESASLVQGSSGRAEIAEVEVPPEPMNGNGSSSSMGVDVAEDSISNANSLRDVGISDETLRLATVRQEIKLQILSGRVEEAMKLLNQHFPFVLQESDSDSLSSDVSASLSAAQASPPPPGTRQTPHAKVNYTSQVSTKPPHISLNLRILAFIEAARTVPLVYARDPKAAKLAQIFTARSFSNFASERKSGVLNVSSSTSAAGSSRAPEGDNDAFSAQQTDLLHRAQRLYASVESLRDTRDRDIYRKELNSVGGLLAYRHPEKSPMAKYMTQERREAVAEQVNSAIMYHLGQPAISHIELFVRQTGATWSVMHDNQILMPPPTQRPVNIASSSTYRETMTSSLPTKGTGKAEKAEAEFVQPFDMKQFLDER